MKTTLTALPLILGTLALLSSPAAAQVRDLSEAEIQQLYSDLLLKETSIVNTDDIELENKQREAIAKEIAYHYTEDAVIKVKEIILTEKNQSVPPFRAKFDRAAYENVMEVERKIKNLNAEYKINNIDYAGQRAVVDVDILYSYKIDANKYSDIVKISADVITKSKCKAHVKIDYDGVARIQNENCASNTFVSNIETEIPEHMEDTMGSGEIVFGTNVIFKR